MIFISPEFFLKSSFQKLLKNKSLFPIPNLIVLDECHCISQWSHNFRPSFYRLIKQFHNKYYIDNKISFLLLTATGNKEVNETVQKWFNIRNEDIYLLNWRRENLNYYIIEETNDKLTVLKTILAKENLKNKPIIIYTGKQSKCEELSKILNSLNYKTGYYHGGMKQEEKDKNHQQFLDNKLKILVCTIAYGMGINKLDINCIIHYDCPLSIEGYIQETGRAGRNGKESFSYVLFNKNDIIDQLYHIYGNCTDFKHLKYLLKLIFIDNFDEKSSSSFVDIENSLSLIDIDENIIEYILVELESKDYLSFINGVNLCVVINDLDRIKNVYIIFIYFYYLFFI